MNLTERDESCLARLASGLGTQESNARAQSLIQSNPEAAEFFRQITSICRALEAHGEACPPPLSPEETETLAVTISTRAERVRAGRKFVFSRPWRWGGAAAAVLAASVAWFSFNRHTQPVVAEVISIRLRASLSAQSTMKSYRSSIRTGQLLETRDQYAVLNLVNGNRIVVARDTCLAIRRKGELIELQSGAVFVQATTPTRVQAGDAVVSLERGLAAMVQTMPPMCTVYSGRAKLSRQGRDTQIPEGHFGSWEHAPETVHTAAFGTKIPPWVQMAFDIAREP